LTDQPWLDGEVEILDPLIDLWKKLRFPLEDFLWESRMAYAFMQAIRFYNGANAMDALELLDGTRASYEAGNLTRDTLKPALMDFDRFAKRVAERGEG